MYREETVDFLSRNVITPIRRDWSFTRRIEPPPLEDSLRVLVVLSNPPATPRLDLDAERERIEEVWKQHHAIDVEVLKRPTLGDLHKCLRVKPFQVLHFMGHGDFDPRSNEGVLYFEPAGNRGMVTGQALAEAVKGTHRLGRGSSSGRHSGRHRHAVFHLRPSRQDLQRCLLLGLGRRRAAALCANVGETLSPHEIREHRAS
ncbi:MAG: CHAT domain-containing protein [Thermoanaerobaculia bacterium]